MAQGPGQGHKSSTKFSFFLSLSPLSPLSFFFFFFSLPPLNNPDPLWMQTTTSKVQLTRG